MVRRFLLFFMLLAVMFCSSACNDEIYGYKTVNLGDFGQMQIPEEWVCSVKDDIMYFTDKALHTYTELCEMKINGTIRTIDVLEIQRNGQAYIFFSIDKSIPKETIKNIANSVTYEKIFSEY